MTERKRWSFEGVACPKCRKLIIPDETDKVEGLWVKGTCFSCGTTLPSLYIYKELE